ISYRAMVKAGVAPGTAIANTVTVTRDTQQNDQGDLCEPGEEPPACDPLIRPDTATVTATTPPPDPELDMTGPTQVDLGDNVTWTIFYSNATREDANQTVILVTFPDGPSTAG